MLKLWHLRIINPASDTVGAAFVVRADTELSARNFASEGSEGGFVWLDAALSTCVELTPEGDAGVVMAVHLDA